MKARMIWNQKGTLGLKPSVLLKATIAIFLAGAILSSHAVAVENFSVTVTRDTSKYYRATGGLTGIIKTQTCLNLASSDQATLQLFTASRGRLIFSNGQECAVVNVFEPATLGSGNYGITVNSAVDGYFELTDGSYLIKAIGFEFASYRSATLNIVSAVNGFASGVLDLGGFAQYSLTNIWWQRPSSVSPTVDLVLTELDLRTAPWDSGGEAITNPSPGTNVYPHLFFDVVGGSTPAMKLYEIRIGNTLLCDFTDDLSAGSYWTQCGPITVPSSDFTLSATLDPNGSLIEVNELNNTQTRTYRVETDEIFKDRFEQ